MKMTFPIRVFSATILALNMATSLHAQSSCTEEKDSAKRDACWKRLENKVELIKKQLGLEPKETLATKLSSKAENDDLEKKTKAITTQLAQKADLGNLLSQVLTSRQFWVLIAGFMVFSMQLGFHYLEAGLVTFAARAKQAVMKIFSWIIPCALYVPWGFYCMFGATYAQVAAMNDEFATEFVLFQLGFAATAVSIPAGAMAERTRPWAFIACAVLITGFIYPVFGQWAWRGIMYQGHDPAREGWLQSRNFLDFAGSTVVHSVGGWVALVAAVIVGPRVGRFAEWKRPSGRDILVLLGWPRTKRFLEGIQPSPPSSLAKAMAGVFLLWAGWWGFNGGSHLKYDPSIANTVLNTNVAGAWGGITAFLLANWGDPGNRYEKLIGGCLGGLVAITASCNVVDMVPACAIGCLAGVVHNFVFDLLLLLHIDDPVGAIPVHAGCGVLGTMCVPLAMRENELTISRLDQFAVQGLGVCVAFVFATVTAFVVLFVLNRIRPLREPISPPPSPSWPSQSPPSGQSTPVAPLANAP